MSAPGTSAEILEWFRAHKMEISAAIRDPFPFLCGLRDKNIICEEDFQYLQDWVTANPNDIQRVVSAVLERIQGNLSAIEEIFCSSNLAAYQDLRPLYESLGNGTQEQSLDFQGTTLPVTCGTAQGTLHVDIFATGVSRKSIEGSNGKWFTPSQFEIEGGRKPWKWWRRSIQCGMTSLDTLIKSGQLPEPPQNPNRTMMSEHDDVCIVSKKEDSRICCSSFPRCFDEDCHIPKISAEKSMSAPGTSDEIFWWFRAHKVQISLAIEDTFPFLYLLRDKKRISEKDFKNWCDKVIAEPNDISKVVYDVLESIQTNVLAIKEIFCKENLEAYQNLQPLYESLENVLQQAQNTPAAVPGSSKVLQGEMKKPASPGEQQRKGMQNNEIQDLSVVVRTLKVRCGRSKGVFYKNRFIGGVSRKCIKGSNGKWFTPLEFKAKGGYKSSKGWRRCIRYGGISLEALIKWGEILKPQPESSRMQKPDDLCAVCCVCCEERGH
ncbi:uncharacterized protein LOC114597663 [Podarcis muralis]